MKASELKKGMRYSLDRDNAILEFVHKVAERDAYYFKVLKSRRQYIVRMYKNQEVAGFTGSIINKLKPMVLLNEINSN